MRGARRGQADAPAACCRMRLGGYRLGGARRRLDARRRRETRAPAHESIVMLASRWRREVRRMGGGGAACTLQQHTRLQHAGALAFSAGQLEAAVTVHASAAGRVPQHEVPASNARFAGCCCIAPAWRVPHRFMATAWMSMAMPATECDVPVQHDGGAFRLCGARPRRVV